MANIEEKTTKGSGEESDVYGTSDQVVNGEVNGDVRTVNSEIFHPRQWQYSDEGKKTVMVKCDHFAWS